MSPDDRARLVAEYMVWTSDPYIVSALMRAGIFTAEDLASIANDLAQEVEEPGALSQAYFDLVGWEILRRDEVRDLIARRVAATAEGVLVSDARAQLKAMRDACKSEVDKALERELPAESREQ